MTFKDAGAFRLRYGEHAGKTLDEVAETGRGLRYLDFLRGQREGKNGPLEQALAAYLDEPAIARELEELVRD